MLYPIQKLVFCSPHAAGVYWWIHLHCQKDFEQSNVKLTICAAIGSSQKDLKP
jgi:hypothetical protein